MGERPLQNGSRGTEKPWWERWPWALALFPIVYAGSRVLAVSQGDPEIVRTLVQNIDVTGLLLSTFLPVGSTIALWVFVGVVAGRVNTDRKEGKRASETFGWVFLPTVLVAALIVSETPAYLVLINGAGLVTIAVAYFAARHRGRARVAARLVPIGFGVVGVVAMVFFTVMFVLGFGQSNWLPRERIDVLEQAPTSGYVVSADPRWTKLLTDDRRIEVVPSTSVLSRHPIQHEPSRWQRPLVNANSDPVVSGSVVTAVLVVLALAILFASAAVQARSVVHDMADQPTTAGPSGAAP
ncbi:hypothetical protein [Williamsia serinedens]|uniref:Uncharacterized protein n=1 Tax=Williamsia serinedens TaxID=391736 RepID=A0ABT1HB25_9NOCA|nr:hypothetical protein [Williamsia serinedens]MCP2163028.1 hypothetical protein [Williamsia serinedens]